MKMTVNVLKAGSRMIGSRVLSSLPRTPRGVLLAGCTVLCAALLGAAKPSAAVNARPAANASITPAVVEHVHAEVDGELLQETSTEASTVIPAARDHNK